MAAARPRALLTHSTNTTSPTPTQDLPTHSMPKSDTARESIPRDHTQALLEGILHAPSLLCPTPEASPLERTHLSIPTPLPKIPLGQKLGHLYEDAITSLIDTSPTLERLARNLQIQENKHHTLGELDFLLREKTTQRIIHLELAVKFYLAYQREDQSWIYPGPNARDNWHNKLKRLQTHQFSLSKHPLTRALLADTYGIQQPPLVQHLILGRLFQHITATAAPLPTLATPSTIWHSWLFHKEWQTHLSNTQDYHLIPKYLWATPLSQDLLSTLPKYSARELKHLSAEHCTLFSSTEKPEALCLVPDHWENASCFTSK